MFSGSRGFLALLLALSPLPIVAQNVPPEVTGTIADATLLKNAAAEVVPLADYFDDPDTSGVRLTTVLGNIDLALYDTRVPTTVANFKNYIDAGRYFKTDPTTGETASSFIHRSVPNFVIQGGGFLSTVNPADPAHALPTQVTPFDPIVNEPGILNTEGTIAMAQVTGDPDSATSQWFINLVDNPSLDPGPGTPGYTVFGHVIGNAMTVIDAIAALPTFNFGSPFESLPLRDYTSGLPTPENLITIPAISYISPLIFTASSDHPNIASATVSGSNLLVSGKAIGSATITVTGTDVDGAQVSQSFAVEVVANPVHLANISTRAVVGAGDDALIGGFVVLGESAKRVAVRALGPSLGDVGITDFLADPMLEIHDSSGATIASNDNWEEAANSQEAIDAGIAPTQPNESTIITTLPASSTGVGYTAVVRGAGGGSGVGLVEVYDLDSGPGSSVLNISTRSDVQSGDNVLIGGFIVFGDGSQEVLVRAIGPSLSGSVADPLDDPTLTLYDAEGTQIDFNDNWQDSPDKDAIIATTIPPNDPKEAAVLQTLAPGGYTAIVRGTGSAPTGTALVEVYALQAP
jgi:cyclophilin family peptidyl-prolyl cis-trans isomerase